MYQIGLPMRSDAVLHVQVNQTIRQTVSEQLDEDLDEYL